MPQSVAHDPAPHSIPRRTFLKVAGGTAALSGLEGILAARRAPAHAQSVEIKVLQWVDFIPEGDVELRRQYAEYGEQTKVKVTLDADPSKALEGTVKQVANVGEQRPNSDAKVFEVVVNIEKPDTALRPGMTTGNEVSTQSMKDVLFVPLDALVVEEGISVVFRQDGGRVIKQEVATGAMNDDEVVIVKGLEEGQTVLLSPPLNRNELEVVRLPGSENMPPAGTSGDTAQRQTVPPATEKQKATPNGEPKRTSPAAAAAAPGRKG